jgi:putative ABC transport system permease protein
VRSGVVVSEGRMFTAGRAEIVAGRALAREFPDFQLGKTVKLGSQAFQVVGLFDAGGSALESEAWADYRLIQTLYERGPNVQSVRVRLADPTQLQALRAYVKEDQRLKLEVVDEKSYYARIASGTLNLIFFLGWPLAIVMSVGALAGLLNAMYASVNARRRELATLRALGFEGFPTFAGTLCEGVLLAALGAGIAIAAAYLVLDGLSASTLGGGFTQVVFSIRLSVRIVTEALALALLVGTLGGLLAAIRATRINALSTFRD